MVCGSYITGNPSERSDIDVHIVLKDGTRWRERGNKIIDGRMIEYFSNPPKQIVEYFKEDHEEGVQMAVIQFLTGRVIFDDGSIKRLQKEAKKWYAKPFNKPSSVSLSLTKYGLWDRGDNLHDALEHDAPHFKVGFDTT